MNCLKRGMLKPCMSFATLNSELIPATCENDFPAMYTQMLGQLLVGRPGFEHNPCFETEWNHYYGSHCTCPAKVYGLDGPDLDYGCAALARVTRCQIENPTVRWI